MVPNEYRLAVEVPDHPIGFGEGIIPSGRYGAGEVLRWDMGIYTPFPWTTEPEVLLGHGEMLFSLIGEKLKGIFHLKRIPGQKRSGKNWLLTKKEDWYSDPTWQMQLRRNPDPPKPRRDQTGWLPFDV